MHQYIGTNIFNLSCTAVLQEINDGPTEKYVQVWEILSKSCNVSKRYYYFHSDAVKKKIKIQENYFSNLPVFPKPDTWTHHLLMNLSP